MTQSPGNRSAADQDFRTLVERSPDIIIRFDRELRCIYVNPAIERLTGISPTFILGKMIDEMTLPALPNQRSERRARLEQIFTTGQEDAFQVVRETPKGTMALDVRLVPEVAAAGRVTGIFAVIRDITSQWQIEQDLRASEARNRALVEALPDGVMRIHRDGTYLEYKSIKVVDEYDAPTQLIVGRKVQDMLPPTIANLILEHHQRALATGQIQTFEAILPLDEMLYYGESRVVPLNSDEVLVVIRDITKRKQAEEALRRSEETVRQQLAEIEAIYAAAPVGLCVLDKELRYIRINETLATLNGFPVAEHLGRTLREILQPVYANLFEPMLQQVLATGQAVRNVEVNASTPNDPTSVRTWLTSYYPLKSEASEVSGVNVVVVEITHLKEAERHLQRTNASLEEQVQARTAELLAANAALQAKIAEQERTDQALRRSEERYRVLVELSPEAIYINQQGRLIYVNPAFVRLMGASDTQQLLGKSPFEIFHPDEQATIYRRRQQLLAQDAPLPTIEQKIVRLDGVIRDVDVTASRYQDEEGVAFQVILRDITERKQAEIAYRESEARYRTLVEQSPDAIYINRQNQIVYANPACRRLLGATADTDILGKSPLDFVHPSGHARAQARIAHLLIEGGVAPVIEQRFRRVDGVDIDVEVTAAAIQDQGQMAIQVILQDITARKQVEDENRRLLAEVTGQRTQLRALNRRLVETQDMERKALARELHDQIGSNLSLLAVNLKRVQNQQTAGLPADDPVHSHFKNLQSLLQQINQRMRDVMVDLWPPVLDDYGLLAALEWYAVRLAAHSQLVVDVQGDEPEPRPAALVEQALFRIAQEALTNVVKHAEASQVVIRLTATAERLWLEVVDNGRGMDPTILNIPSQEQTWGLLNMRERAQAVGGNLRIVARPGEGTSIIVDAPLV